MMPSKPESELTHLDSNHEARMVDVAHKPATVRTAIAEGCIRMEAATLAVVLSADAPKGNVIGTARIAGIMAAKRTADLVPLCHPLPLSSVALQFFPDTATGKIRVRSEVRTSAPTGVEMEALTSVTVALLTIYDMAKAVQKDMVLGEIRLLFKEGGKSGTFGTRPE